MANTYCKKCKVDIKKYLKSNIRINYCPICGARLSSNKEIIEENTINKEKNIINNNQYLPEFLTKDLK